jgi:hypothetical protein
MRKTLQTIEKLAKNRTAALASAAFVQYGYPRPAKQDFTRQDLAGFGCPRVQISQATSYFTGILRFRGISR